MRIKHTDPVGIKKMEAFFTEGAQQQTAFPEVLAGVKERFNPELVCDFMDHFDRSAPSLSAIYHRFLESVEGLP